MTSSKPAANPHVPCPFPVWWASDWGQDKIGLWMAFTYKDVRQLFRWIRPGTFKMGDTRSKHVVTLTQGYWLADSTCTQALWQAVMGDNPAHFKESENNPVDHVSWGDTQQFIGRLNDIISGLNACLPTEIQWQYACRAGTETAFSFGENITPQQVNYDGNYPYEGGEKGQYRKKTVPVKSLPANPWGLYEMHGNVWEWCQDCYDDYPADPVINPVGPKEGVDRVLRGGSWYSYGGDVRSAFRDGGEPGFRSHFIGFRLALGRTAGIHLDKASQDKASRE